MSEQPIESLRDAALALARDGIPVFPCAPDRKIPLTAHGFHDATTDPRRVKAWWDADPRANIGVPTGAPGSDVLDVDVRATGSGFPALRDLRQAGLVSGWNSAVRTPSGGLHLYFTGTAQPCGSVPPAHIDFRGHGGYVLVPPSTVDGRPYRCVAHRSAVREPLDWTAITAQLRPETDRPRPGTAQQAGPPDLARLTSWVEKQPEGNRNRGLYWAACRLPSTSERELTALIDAAVRAGLPRPEARRTVASARARIGAAPRSTFPSRTDQRLATTPTRWL